MDRFWSKVAKGDSCWLWTAAVSNGYGRFAITRTRLVYAHRYAYELSVGPIPDGLQLDHLCRVPLCVNPAHLEPVTPAVNVDRSDVANRRKVSCPKSHPYDLTDSANRRRCRACKNENKRASRARARAAGRAVT